MPKTKIVCTIGPASESREVIRQLIRNGMNVARLNFSHGTHGAHEEKIKRIRSVSDELGVPIAVLQDLGGPKIRVGEVKKKGIRLIAGRSFVLTTRPVQGDEEQVSVTYESLPAEVKPNDRLLLADGLMELVVKETSETDIFCEVVIGGLLSSHKGINLPTGTLKTPALTEKDQSDLLFGLANGIDYVALSFVRTAEDIRAIKHLMGNNGYDVPVIAKIEKHEALENLEDILDVSDGIMVARGDLGVEIPLENVPKLQKKLIRKANVLGKPVIIATQMLRSMVDSPRPTRAEATDVANGVLDGADAIMLSEETASGNYPIESVQFMVRIAESAESQYPHEKYLHLMRRNGVSESVAYASCVLANDLNAAAIVATTRSGLTATHISNFRPRQKIIALSPDKTAIRRLALFWGCLPCFLKLSNDTDEMIENAAVSALHTGLVEKGDTAIITAGRPIWVAGTTNLLWVKIL